jgi:hypothetical protein
MMPSTMIRPALIQMGNVFGQSDQSALELVKLIHQLNLPPETLAQLQRVGQALASETTHGAPRIEIASNG